MDPVGREAMAQILRDQTYVLQNISRELVGQARNFNAKPLTDYPLCINVCYTQYEVL